MEFFCKNLIDKKKGRGAFTISLIKMQTDSKSKIPTNTCFLKKTYAIVLKCLNLFKKNL